MPGNKDKRFGYKLYLKKKIKKIYPFNVFYFIFLNSFHNSYFGDVIKKL